MKKLFLLDAYALIYRAYYAFINNPMTNSAGMNTSAILGFVNALEDILKNENPSHIAVAFDPGKKTFRHDFFPEYKGNRPPTPEDIKISIPWIKKILNAYKIPILISDNFEADDLIGSLAKRFANNEMSVFMMTSDKDYKQLIDDNIFIYKLGRSGKKPEIIDKKNLQDEYNIENPLQIIDILALWGDAADNIPGIPGVGEKTAAKLVAQYKSIENIYENIDQLKNKLKENLIEFSDRLFLSKKLITIDTNVELDCNINDLQIQEPDKETLVDIFSELDFNVLKSKYSKNETFLTNIEEKKIQTKSKKNVSDSIQLDLFSSIEINENKNIQENIESDKDENLEENFISFSPKNVDYQFIDASNIEIE